MKTLVFATLIALVTVQSSGANVLKTIRSRGALFWGADQEGGGPFVYPDPADPAKLVGFEVDLAALLAAELGVKPQFFQADWNTLPSFLDSGKIDIILNGYELTPARSAQMAASRPYYIYELQLLARDDDTRIRSWDDLRKPLPDRKWQISVLGGTAAAQYLRENFADSVDIVEYNGNTDAMLQVRSGVHDATLADLCVAIFFRDQPQEKGLRFVGPPVAPGYYVIYARKGETQLIAALDAAIDKAIRDGRLKAIYDKYNLWNSTQERLASSSSTIATSTAPTGWTVVRRYGPILVQAALVTVKISVLAMPVAIVLGLLVALGRLYGPRWLRPLLTIYVELLRGTPVMLQLYVIYFLLPTILPFSFNPIVAAVIGLAINYSAYESEIYRAGIQAIPEGQMQAALALGMTRAVAIRRVILPQAVRLVIPPVTNDFIALFKDTSICSVIAVTELTKQYNMFANSTGAILELAAMTAVLYLCMSYPLSLFARYMEGRLGVLKPAI